MFEKYANTKCDENTFSGRQVDPRGPRDGQMNKETDMTKQIVAFRNFVNASNKKRKRKQRDIKFRFT